VKVSGKQQHTMQVAAKKESGENHCCTLYIDLARPQPGSELEPRQAVALPGGR
jgi:hypothetical protein